MVPFTGDRGFESVSLQRRVHCEPEFSGEDPIDVSLAESLLCCDWLVRLRIADQKGIQIAHPKRKANSPTRAKAAH